MPKLLLAEGVAADLANQEIFRTLDESLREGDRIEWLFYLTATPPAAAVQMLYDNLVAHGLSLWGGGVFMSDNRTMVVRAVKDISPLTFIAIVVVSITVLFLLASTWSLFQTMEAGGAGWLTFVGAGGVLLVLLLSQGRRREEIIIRR